MEYRTLGNTGLSLSVLAFGTAPLGDMFGPADEKSALATVGTALDSGINFFDSSPYYGDGLAERRLGKALRTHRQEVFIGTKAGRYKNDQFDFRPARIRESLERSLRLLKTDYVDILQLHDIEFVKLDEVFTESYPELVKLRDEGKVRFIGMTGYPMHALRRAATETRLDTVLSYAHYTLLNTQLSTDLIPVCNERGTGVINAAAVSLGLLTASGSRFLHHPATDAIKSAAAGVTRYCQELGVDVAFLANQFSIQRSGASTTVVGTTTAEHLETAVRAASTPIDEQLLSKVLSRTAHVQKVSWLSGRMENNSGWISRSQVDAQRR